MKTNCDQTENPLRKIWEIDPVFICPVSGVCFSYAEQKKILKTPGCQKSCGSLFEMHQSLMADLQDQNRLSEKAQRILQNKYADFIQSHCSMDEKIFLKEWRESLLTEKMAPLFYIGITHKGFSTETLEKIFEDIHMAGFSAVTALLKEEQKTTRTEEENQKLKQHFSREKKRLKALSLENSRLKALNQQEKNNRSFNPPGKKINPTDRVEQIERTINRLEKTIYDRDREIIRLEREKRKAEIAMFEARSSTEKLEQELCQLIEGFKQIESAHGCTKEDCPRYDFCSKRILIVGGMTKLKELYKNVVESRGGIFDYHSGRIRNGKQNLESRVKRSDLVICPVNCNSHNACQKVKHLCTKHRKDIRLINNSSLSAISKVLSSPRAK